MIYLILAHLRLFGRRKKVVVGGLHWQYCGHWSHRWTLPCYRWAVHDGYCTKHDLACYPECVK